MKKTVLITGTSSGIGSASARRRSARPGAPEAVGTGLLGSIADAGRENSRDSDSDYVLSTIGNSARLAGSSESPFSFRRIFRDDAHQEMEQLEARSAKSLSDFQRSVKSLLSPRGC